METNIERIREKLIQKEMAEVLRKVQDGEFTKEAEALVAKARRREKKRQLWRESSLEYAGCMVLKAMDKIICGLYKPFTKRPEWMEVLCFFGSVAVVCYCVLDLVLIEHFYGTGAFWQAIESGSLPDFGQVVAFRGAVANSVFHLIIAVMTFVVYPVACSWDEDEPVAGRSTFLALGCCWLLGWMAMGWNYGWSLFWDICWLQAVWGIASWTMWRFFNPLDVGSGYKLGVRSPVRRLIAQYEAI